MGLHVEQSLKGRAIGRLVRGARSFYTLLANRRKYERLPLSGNVFLVCNGLAVETSYACLCVDVSPCGIGIECPEPLSAGAFVQLYTAENGPRRSARVRYCLPGEGRHRIGLEFLEGHGRRGPYADSAMG